MLQLAFALHHHHASSIHDDHDSFHSVSTTIAKKICNTLDFNADVPPRILLHYCPIITETVYQGRKSPITETISHPTQSRAPPTSV